MSNIFGFIDQKINQVEQPPEYKFRQEFEYVEGYSISRRSYEARKAVQVFDLDEKIDKKCFEEAQIEQSEPQPFKMVTEMTNKYTERSNVDVAKQDKLVRQNSCNLFQNSKPSPQKRIKKRQKPGYARESINLNEQVRLYNIQKLKEKDSNQKENQGNNIEAQQINNFILNQEQKAQNQKLQIIQANLYNHKPIKPPGQEKLVNQQITSQKTQQNQNINQQFKNLIKSNIGQREIQPSCFKSPFSLFLIGLQLDLNIQNLQSVVQSTEHKVLLNACNFILNQSINQTQIVTKIEAQEFICDLHEEKNQNEGKKYN